MRIFLRFSKVNISCYFGCSLLNRICAAWEKELITGVERMYNLDSSYQ